MEARDQKEDFVVGTSPLMQDVFARMQAAAGGTGNVLLTGESGTGKDLAARYMHRNSDLAEGPFVPVNCGAIPKELFESELFGHVKGAFTGAVSDTAGLFTAADGGTIFLDEVTEIPSEMQVKLLRVLQDSRIRAIGSTEEVPLDVMMPGMDGFEVCRRLMAHPELQKIPVIFLTALDDPSDAAKCYQVGGVDYVTKPFQKEEVLVHVRVHLERVFLARALAAEIARREG